MDYCGSLLTYLLSSPDPRSRCTKILLGRRRLYDDSAYPSWAVFRQRKSGSESAGRPLWANHHKRPISSAIPWVQHAPEDFRGMEFSALGFRTCCGC